MIYFPDALTAQMIASAEKAYPDECCGFLFGHLDGIDRRVTEVMPADNRFGEEERFHRFVITPEQMLEAEIYARKQRLDIVGFYHSHPDHPAVPSEYDLSHALPVYSYPIVSVQSGKAVNIRSWQIDPAADKLIFTEETIVRGDI